MKRNVMKNLWRFLAVLPLRVRGSQRELRTPPPSTDSRLSVVFICHLGFGIWNLFSIRPLTFGNCLPASVRQLPRLANIKGKPTKRIVRTLTTESSGGNRLTYEKGLLNSRKTAIFTKRIIPPSLILFPLSVATLHPEPALRRCRIREHHTGQARYKSGITSPEYPT